MKRDAGDEPSDQEEQKRGGTDSRSADGVDQLLPARWHDGEASTWETLPAELANLADLSLSDILIEAAGLLGVDVDDGQRYQIRLRDGPPGFRAVMGKIADEHYISYSALSRITLEHGMAILDATPWIARLRGAYETARRKGMDDGDADALKRINRVLHYSFKEPQPLSTTLDVSRKTAGRISDLAMKCGIPRPKLAVIAVAASLLTMRNNRGYRRILISEMDAFRRFVIRATRELQLD